MSNRKRRCSKARRRLTTPRVSLSRWRSWLEKLIQRDAAALLTLLQRGQAGLEFEAHEEVQAVNQIGGQIGRQMVLRRQGLDARHGAGGGDPVGQRQAAHAMHQRESAGALQVQLLAVAVAQMQQLVPPTLALLESVDDGSKSAPAAHRCPALA